MTVVRDGPDRPAVVELDQVWREYPGVRVDGHDVARLSDRPTVA